MIEVICPSARFNTHQEQYNRHANRIDLITLKINVAEAQIQTGLTVEEAEKLADDLMEWVREIKGEEGEPT
jgi:hypothetical protein